MWDNGYTGGMAKVVVLGVDEVDGRDVFTYAIFSDRLCDEFADYVANLQVDSADSAPESGAGS